MDSSDENIQKRLSDIIKPTASANESKEDPVITIDQQLIDEMRCDIIDVDLDHSHFIKISSTQQIHKTTYIKSLFDKNHKYYTDRILNCQRRYKNYKPIEVTPMIGDVDCILEGDYGVTLIRFKNNLYVVIIKILTIHYRANRVSHLAMDKLNNPNENTTFTFYIASKIQHDIDDNGDLRWFETNCQKA